MTNQDPLPRLDESFPRRYEATALRWVSTEPGRALLASGAYGAEGDITPTT